MGLFKDIFGASTEQSSSKFQWNYLESIADLDVAEELSNEKTVVLFKHSTRCSISRFVLKQFENSVVIPAEKMEFYFLDLIENRSISNEIAERFGVIHQSPQMIVLQEGKAVYNASHESIDAKALEKLV